MAMKEFYLCCGALIDQGGKTSEAFLKTGKPSQALLTAYNIGYIFTDKALEGFEKICEGLYYIHRDITWVKPNKRNWGKEPPGPFLELGYPLPYIIKDQKILGINLVSNFPFGSQYNVKPLIVENVKEHEHEDSIAIMNTAQSKFYEDMVLNLGFKVLNRTVNPRHASDIVLYHRPPGELTIEA